MKSHNCCIRKRFIYFSWIKYLKEILMLHITCSRGTPSFIVLLWCIFLLLERLIQIAEVSWIFYGLGVVNDQKSLSLICSGLTIQQCSNSTQQRNRLWKQKPSWIIFCIPAFLLRAFLWQLQVPPICIEQSTSVVQSNILFMSLLC